MRVLGGIIASSIALAGCTYNAAVGVSPNLNVYTSYSDKLAGTYLLYVDPEAFNRVVKPTGYVCSAHSYPLDFRDAFRQSAVATMQQLVQNVQVLDHPATSDEIRSKGAVGMIVIKSESLNPRLLFVEGFWTGTADARVETSASVTVDGSAGRLLGTTAEGAGTDQIGGNCGIGAEALGKASEGAIKQLLGQLGERVANSPRLRGANSTTASR